MKFSLYSGPYGRCFFALSIVKNIEYLSGCWTFFWMPRLSLAVRPEKRANTTGIWFSAIFRGNYILEASTAHNISVEYRVIGARRAPPSILLVQIFGSFPKFIPSPPSWQIFCSHTICGENMVFLTKKYKRNRARE